MRAFLCIPVPAPARRVLAQTSDALRRSTDMRASWVAEANYHITVRFLGEIDPMLTIDLEQVACEVAERHVAFDLRIDRIGAFPSLERARVVWAGVETPRVFADLAGDLNRGLERLGFEGERRRPEAHVTLARIKGRPDPKLSGVAARMNPLEAMELPVKRVVLMESQLGPRGATYVPLFEVTLRAGSG